MWTDWKSLKAVRYHGRKDIRIENVREPDGYGPNRLLVKPLWTGICGTDLHHRRPDRDARRTPCLYAATLPQVLGHEFSAEVFEVGKDVTNLRRGDRISIQPLVSAAPARQSATLAPLEAVP
jgi:(R,R)-butanediol dehydrogenase/meso-butanediol dehydrogenase/diacetyl reductase